MTINLLTLAEFMEMPEPAWLVESTLPAGGFALLYGESGAGKSFVALDICLSVSCGLPWAGRQVVQGEALYVVAEGVAGLRTRARAWLKHHHVTDAPLRLIPGAVQFGDANAVKELVSAIVAAGFRPTLIVIDTLSRCAVGLEENSSAEMGGFIAALSAIQQYFSASILLIHHASRGTGLERGSTAIRASMDAVLRVVRAGESCAVTCEKMKDGPDFEPLTFQMAAMGNSLVLVPSTEPAHGPGLLRSELLVLAALDAAPAGLSPIAVRTATQLSEAQVTRLCRRLKAQGLIQQESPRAPYSVTAAGKQTVMRQSPSPHDGSIIRSIPSHPFRGDGDGLDGWDGQGVS